MITVDFSGQFTVRSWRGEHDEREIREVLVRALRDVDWVVGVSTGMLDIVPAVRPRPDYDPRVDHPERFTEGQV